MMFRLVQGRSLVASAVLGLILTACTKTTPQRVVDPQKDPAPPPSGPVAAAEGNGQNSTGATVPVSIPYADIKNRDIDLSKMTFTARFAGVVRTGAIRVEGSRVTMNITDLPIGKNDNFVLTLEESGIVKLSGTATNVELKAGNNVVDIVLRPTTQQPPPGGGDPTKVSYERDLRPSLENACGECHHRGKPLDLTGYPQVPDLNILVDRMIERTSGTSGALMPPAPRDRLDQAVVQKISQWKRDGFQP